MKSKLIVGIPLAVIAMAMVYNFISSPPVAFANIRGHYMAAGGPYEGCVLLLQPGAGIKVSGNFGANEAKTPDLTGEVKGNMFNFEYTIAGGEAGSSKLLVSPTDLKGEWNSNSSEGGTWSWTKMKDGCPN